MPTKTFHLICSDGHQMPMYAWLPISEPDAVLHIAHGMAEYAERYADIAQMLVQKNIAVYAHDQRGHGNAVTSINELGIVKSNWFYQQIEDIHLAIQFLRKKHSGKKIFLLGHSMGSFICQRYFQIYGKEIDGLILSASNGKQDPLMSAGIAIAWLQIKILGPRYRSKLIDTLSFGKFNAAFNPNRTKYDWLSRSNKEVDKYITDPQCGFICSAQFFYYFFKGIKDAFQKEKIKNMPNSIPVYAFAGDQDPVGLASKGFLTLIENWKEAGVKDLSYNLYKGGRHEMMNETNREEVITDLVSWIKNHW
jgi:alpha-beta hydrolase superfamily lysophospholipase